MYYMIHIDKKYTLMTYNTYNFMKHNKAKISLHGKQCYLNGISSSIPFIVLPIKHLFFRVAWSTVV